MTMKPDWEEYLEYLDDTYPYDDEEERDREE